MNKKYTFTEKHYESKDDEGYYHTLHQIKAVRDFGNIKAGDLGGYIEDESCLSHEGACWVGPNMEVYKDASVADNAIITCDGVPTTLIPTGTQTISNARVYGDARIHNARVYGDPWMPEIEIHGNAVINGGGVRNAAQVYGDANVDNSWIEYKTVICGNTTVINSEVNTDKTYTEGVIENTRIYE